LGWLKRREQAVPPDAEVGGRAQNDARPHSKGKYLLEPLEPRVLLSADSILGEVYRTLLDDEGRGPGAEFAVIVEEIDAATSAEITAADGDGYGSAASEFDASVAWPESWETEVADGSTQDPDSAFLEDLEASVPETSSADDQTPEAALYDVAGATSTAPEDSASQDDSSLVSAGDDDPVASTIPVSELPRGPPSEDATSSALIAADSISNNELSPSDSPAGDEGGLFGVQEALFDPSVV